jgi:hypothetical protein
MRIAHLKIGLFALFLVAPVACLLLFGSVDSFGREQPDFPMLKQVLSAKGRTQFGDAVLERSGAMKLAVKLYNWVGYRVVGFVATTLVISGKDDWLFYRPEFVDGACIDFDRVEVQFRQLRTLMDIAQASGLDMRVSISPNKSTIYPDSLHPLVRGYWRCRARNAAGLRRLFKKDVPGLIDHAEPLLAERTRHPGIPLYFTGDTHWTPYGGAIALRQLIAAIYPDVDAPAPQLSGALITQKVDLASSLQWPVEEQVGEVATLPQAILDQLNRKSAGLRTVILHDSFYNRIAPQVREVFPNAIIVRGGKDSAWYVAEIGAADRLIVNIVERELVRAIRDGKLSWNAAIPAAVMARNVRLAEQCASFEAIGGDVGGVIAIRSVAPRRLPCLRISLTARTSTIVEIALPDASSGAFEPGHAIRYQVSPGSQTIGLILPDYTAGSRVRLERLGKQAAISKIEIREIGRPANLSASEPQP